MTKHALNDELRTAELVRQLNTDTSWLRHRGLAGELDRRLLQGATEAELAEIRVSWRGHVTHLRKEHHLQVIEERAGFWRITGSGIGTPIAAPALENVIDELADDDDYEDGGVSSSDTLQEAQGKKYLRLSETARAISALAKEGLLGEGVLKASVGMLIRQASESNHWHNCADYRSKQAAALIRRRKLDDPTIASTAARYQAFCRSNLRHEHVVPNSVIYEMLTKLTTPSVERISELLKAFCIRATITRDEDGKLNECGLSSSMPSWFYARQDGRFENPLARYIEVELDQELVPLPPGMLWHQVP